jgi:hypothetical protein
MRTESGKWTQGAALHVHRDNPGAIEQFVHVRRQLQRESGMYGSLRGGPTGFLVKAHGIRGTESDVVRAHTDSDERRSAFAHRARPYLQSFTWNLACLP